MFANVKVVISPPIAGILFYLAALITKGLQVRKLTVETVLGSVEDGDGPLWVEMQLGCPIGV